MESLVCIHCHFYQPPRENPWLEAVEAQDSASPDHDWNARIARECYLANGAARILDGQGRIAKIVNNYARISFNFGPTLLAWLEEKRPEVYRAILEADAASRQRFSGHGSALAQGYNHIIMPLANRRDKQTQIRWGIADFERRFGRRPEGMWLPETAVDPETLDVLAAEGIAFTILAPHQVEQAPADGSAGRYRTSGGRSIALFVYDGPISHDVAFGSLLKDASAWAERLLAPGKRGHERRLVAVATDGETYGHHHKFGEVALAWVLRELERRRDARVENFAPFLARHRPEQEVKLVAPTSWSCAHGVERWRADCGCRMAPERPTQQRWRAPLREALDWLAGELHARFEQEGGALFAGSWAARDAYGTDRTADGRARELLEMERNALRMFTSCGWFFDDIAGIETIQILRYAARAIELAGADAPRLEAGVLERLARAQSNERAEGTGRDVYRNHVKRRVPVESAARTDAHAADSGDDAARALLRAVLALEHDHSPRAIAAVTELADRAQRDGGHIPFDAQTAFYRIRAAAPPERAAQLASVAWRLGFADGEVEGKGKGGSH